jgi:hypothetical protein
MALEEIAPPASVATAQQAARTGGRILRIGNSRNVVERNQ